MRKMLPKNVISFLMYCQVVDALNNTKLLLKDLLVDYQKYARPVNNENDTLMLKVGLYLKSIQEFDEVQERFSYVAGLTIVWQDVGMVWDPSQYGGVNKVTVSWEEVWVPDLLLINPAKETKSLGLKWHTVRYFSNGVAYWLPGYLLETSCPVNTRNYPFDTQICTTSFQCAGTPKKEIDIQREGTEVDISGYRGNGAWKLTKTEIKTHHTSGLAHIDFTFYLKRKPGYVIINIIIPILFLSLLNVLVFVLAPESGERVSFCITVLLSIVVFMTIVSDTLPKSSEPVPIVSYKLIIDMVLSSLITVVTIFNLGIYNKPETEVKPGWVLRVYNCSYRHKCITSDKEYLGDINMEPKPNRSALTMKEDNAIAEQKPEHTAKSMMCTCSTQITWKNISRLLDRIFLAFFTIALMSSYTVFLLIIVTA